MSKQVVYVYPVSKSPNKDYRRFGPEDLHDWRQALRLAILIVAECNANGMDACLLVVSAFKPLGQESELQVYQREARLMGYRGPVLFVQSGYHTGDQVKIAQKVRNRHRRKAMLIMTSTAFHFWHAEFYADDETLHRLAWGIPNTREVFKDLFMPVVAWVIHFCGLEHRFHKWVVKRRRAGIL